VNPVRNVKHGPSAVIARRVNHANRVRSGRSLRAKFSQGQNPDHRKSSALKAQAKPVAAGAAAAAVAAVIVVSVVSAVAAASVANQPSAENAQHNRNKENAMRRQRTRRALNGQNVEPRPRPDCRHRRSLMRRT